jgi:hypothetical protein
MIELTESNEPVLTEQQMKDFIETWNKCFPDCNLREIQLLPYPYKGIAIDFHLNGSWCPFQTMHYLKLALRGKKCDISIGEMYSFKHEFDKYCSEIRMTITYSIYIDSI